MTSSKCVPAPWGSLLSISSGIDWLSCSAPLSDEDWSLYAVARAAIRVQRLSGGLEKPWKMKGLTGWIANGIVAARSPTLAFASVSGANATEYFPILFPSAQHVSRLDLQLTARFQPGTAKGLAHALYNAPFGPTTTGRPPARTLLTTAAGGATCYIGKRKSEVFGRCYDKGVEEDSDPPGTLWRWEVELKNNTATLTAKELDQCESLASEAGSMVCGRFWQWGYSIPCSSWSGLPFQVDKRRPDSAKTLEWLRTGVRPSVDRLIAAGLAREVREALGLS